MNGLSVNSLKAELRRTRRGWALAALQLLLAVMLQLMASRFPHFIERSYSRQFYPVIARLLSALNQVPGFAIAEPLLWLLLAWLLFLCAKGAGRLFREPSRIFLSLLHAMQRLLLLTGSVALLFLFMWGFNYQRQPVSVQLQLGERAPTVDELETITRFLIERANENYDAAAKSLPASSLADWKTHSTLPLSREALHQRIEESYQQHEVIPERLRVPLSAAKPALISRLMLRLRISGIFIPFTGEPLFNSGQPDSELPFSIAHEKAHQRGYAREDEASFIAFLICTRSSEAYIRYTAYLDALSVAGRWRMLLASQSQPPERYREVITRLGEGPRTDLQYAAKFWQQYQGALSRVSHTVNDSYLKANRVPGGVMSYNDADGLIIRYYLQHPELMKQNETEKN